MSVDSAKMICKRLKYCMLKRICKKQSVMTPEEARNILDNIHTKLEISCIRNNKIIPSEYDLQIVVPVYNVENYLEECLESIINNRVIQFNNRKT